jgi:hypothetical protein
VESRCLIPNPRPCPPARQDVHELYDFDEGGAALGRGTYGVVLRAVHRHTAVPYACKLLYINRTRSGDDRKA